MTEQELRQDASITSDNLVDTLLFYMQECKDDFSPEEVAKIFIEEFSAMALQVAKEISNDE